MILCNYGAFQFERRWVIEMRKINIFGVAAIVMLSATAVCMTVPVKATPFIRVYVDQSPEGYIPGVPVGALVVVDLIIEVSGILDNTPEGIVSWAMDVAVDPNVLEPSGLVSGAMVGYFLYEFATDYGYPPPILDPGKVSNGYWSELTEMIISMQPGGAGEGYSGRKLVTLMFYSKSEYLTSIIDLIDIAYFDATGTWHPVDEVIDGRYNLPPVPEFPIGPALEILFIPVIIYILWSSKHRKKVLP